MIFTKISGFQDLSFVTFDSGSGRLRASFAVSGINRSDKLQVLESPRNDISFGTFAFLSLKNVRTY